VASIVAILGGLIVGPGTAVLIRLALDVPDVRLDRQGIVWGTDRTRDLAIAWLEIETAASKLQATEFLTDRLIVFRPRPGVSVRRPRTIYGRFTALSNRMTSGSPYAISTFFANQPWDVISASVERHLGRPIDQV
jgi:hypothetical protein